MVPYSAALDLPHALVEWVTMLIVTREPMMWLPLIGRPALRDDSAATARASGGDPAWSAALGTLPQTSSVTCPTDDAWSAKLHGTSR